MHGFNLLPIRVKHQDSPSGSDDTGGSLSEDNFEPLEDSQLTHEDSDINLISQANLQQDWLLGMCICLSVPPSIPPSIPALQISTSKAMPRSF